MSSNGWEPTQASLRDGETRDRDSHAARNAAQLRLVKQEQAKSDITDLIDDHEDVNWGGIPTISAAEAAAWTARLEKAREKLERGDVDGT